MTNEGNEENEGNERRRRGAGSMLIRKDGMRRSVMMKTVRVRDGEFSRPR
jgi:hypothetical protein